MSLYVLYALYVDFVQWVYSFTCKCRENEEQREKKKKKRGEEKKALRGWECGWWEWKVLGDEENSILRWKCGSSEFYIQQHITDSICTRLHMCIPQPHMYEMGSSNEKTYYRTPKHNIIIFKKVSERLQPMESKAETNHIYMYKSHFLGVHPVLKMRIRKQLYLLNLLFYLLNPIVVTEPSIAHAHKLASETEMQDKKQTKRWTAANRTARTIHHFDSHGNPNWTSKTLYHTLQNRPIVIPSSKEKRRALIINIASLWLRCDFAFFFLFCLLLFVIAIL